MARYEKFVTKDGLRVSIPRPSKKMLVREGVQYHCIAHRPAKPGELVYSITKGVFITKEAGTQTAYWIVEQVKAKR